MARYFFGTPNVTTKRDIESVELDNINVARRQAVAHAANILHREPPVIWEGDDINVEVRNETGLLLTIITVYATDAPVLRSIKK